MIIRKGFHDINPANEAPEFFSLLLIDARIFRKFQPGRNSAIRVRYGSYHLQGRHTIYRRKSCSEIPARLKKISRGAQLPIEVSRSEWSVKLSSNEPFTRVIHVAQHLPCQSALSTSSSVKSLASYLIRDGRSCQKSPRRENIFSWELSSL